MKKILYIGNEISKISSGADSVNKRNLDILTLLFPSSNIIVKKLEEYNTLCDKLNFYIVGLSSELENDILNSIENDTEIKYVFLSQSLLGRIAKKIKNKFGKQIKVITFYHNIEKHYAKEFIKTEGISHYPFYLCASYNEKRAVMSSDINIVMNKRDGIKLNENYHVQAGLILPATYKDNFNKIECRSAKSEIDYLFVGTSFFANIEAIRWFIKNVFPNVNGKLTIIGKGMESFKSEFENDRVIVLGFVDDLSEYYYKSKVVIAPILSGGGMKTKIAEALMYGKKILGSKEAFEGYVENTNAMVLCNTAKDYINFVNSAEFINQPLFNEPSRVCFVANYSNEVILSKLKSIFND